MKIKYTKGITYVVVGDRDIGHMRKSIEIVRQYDQDIPITIYHDIPQNRLPVSGLKNLKFRPFKRISYPYREENRNSSLWRLISLRESPYDVTLYLDNDIYIVHPGFFEGFEIAYNYGISMVQNPRMFIKTREGTIGDMDIGVDVQPYDKQFVQDMPNYMTSYNMGVTFCDKGSTKFLDALIDEQYENPTRGQAGLYRTIWKTKQSPYCLPINWLVCKKHCGLDNPLALHVGHDNVLKWWEASYK